MSARRSNNNKQPLKIVRVQGTKIKQTIAERDCCFLVVRIETPASLLLTELT